jgi:hypothetical protein
MAENARPWVSIERLDISGGTAPGRSKIHAEITAFSVEYGAFRVSVDFEQEIEPQFQWKSIQTEAIRRIGRALDPGLLQ